MVNERYRKAMSETLHYLKGINQDDIIKIPNKFIQFLKENSLQNYECNFDYKKPLKDLNLMDETRGLISMICLNYWCETEEQKNNFIKHLNENEIRYQEELKEKYNVDDIFKNANKSQNMIKEISESTTNTSLVVYKESPFTKFKNFILKILHLNK